MVANGITYSDYSGGAQWIGVLHILYGLDANTLHCSSDSVQYFTNGSIKAATAASSDRAVNMGSYARFMYSCGITNNTTYPPRQMSILKKASMFNTAMDSLPIGFVPGISTGAWYTKNTKVYPNENIATGSCILFLRHSRRSNVLFMDGSVRACDYGTLKGNSIWNY